MWLQPPQRELRLCLEGRLEGMAGSGKPSGVLLGCSGGRKKGDIPKFAP